MTLSTTLLASGPVQLAYYVDDPAAAAEQAAARFGWGPFFLLEHIALEWSKYRGQPSPFDHTSAYGQAGGLMIEFITQHNDDASALRDMYAPGERGLHHVAYFVPDLAAALAEATALGYEQALAARTATGVHFVMLDTVAQFGHMVELYEPGDDLRRFYAHVKRCSENWTGTDPVRRLG